MNDTFALFPGRQLRALPDVTLKKGTARLGVIWTDRRFGPR